MATSRGVRPAVFFWRRAAGGAWQSRTRCITLAASQRKRQSKADTCAAIRPERHCRGSFLEASRQIERVLSSAGRAAPLQGVGRGFDPLSTHHRLIRKIKDLECTRSFFLPFAIGRSPTPGGLQALIPASQRLLSGVSAAVLLAVLRAVLRAVLPSANPSAGRPALG